MKITATQIAEWAKTIEARGALPKLLRRLIHASASPTDISFPADDSTSLPDWDGEVTCEQGSPWVPSGKSYWELSCEGSPTAKANKDYNKRTKETPESIRMSSTLVVVSARKWSGKKRWIKGKQSAAEWTEVRAYDADDLEQWLEQSPAVALQYAEELGLSGPGVVSTSSNWKAWAEQSEPMISVKAMFYDRENLRERLIEELRSRITSGQAAILSVKADSVEEATAFVCAALTDCEDLSANSVVVTASDGWRFVEHNPSIKVAVAAKPEIAEKPSRRSGLLVIIPYSAGDMAGYYKGVAGQDHADIVVERPKIYEFEKALTSIGLDEADSKRLALSTGRSWSVYRRRHAVNPAIRRPVWLGEQQSAALSVLCLLGAWSSESAADREIVVRLTSRTYEEVERALQYLSVLEDSPILRIGNVWKAKSPLELLDLFGDRITSDELERFFAISHDILIAPDPVLELPEDKRYAAQIYGKTRPQSGLLISSLCDTLIKLAVRGPQVPTLLSTNIEGLVHSFVGELLYKADKTRWLSLSTFLPSLAEAAPDAFLKAIALSFSAPDAPVTQLLVETNSSGLMGRCWHAGLLWALETLAWAPERLARVALLLTRLSHFKIKGNWGNTPKASLLDIFRSWIPQTAADLNQRVAVLDTLISKDPDAAFDLLDSLVHVGQDFASPSARPRWRDDDAGAGRGVTNGERAEMLIAAADRLVACSEDNPQRIARLIKKISIFETTWVKAALALVEKFTESSTPDEEREIIRTALRREIAWHSNYGEVKGKSLNNKLLPLETLYERLAPSDLMVRHRWLFSDSWPELPIRLRDSGDYKKRDKIVETLRNTALQEVYAEHGIVGIEQLAGSCKNQQYIGVWLSKLGLATSDMADWIVKKGDDFMLNRPLTMTIAGLIRALSETKSSSVIRAVLERGNAEKWNALRIAQFLVLAREERVTWDMAISCGAEVEDAYWAIVRPNFWLRDNKADFEFALRRLLKSSRPRSALQLCHLDLENVPSDLLVEMLEHMLIGEETAQPLLDPWHIGEALDLIESSGEIERDRLIRLEFGLIPALGYTGEQRAKVLYASIMSEPRLFIELLGILYRPADDNNPPSRAVQAIAETAWHILEHCRRQPGTQSDGTIDRDAFIRFIEESRELAREANRLQECDKTLGRILAYAPADSDGVWPFNPARDVLDRQELEDMRRGFQIGVLNNRDITMRGPDEGGEQERQLADSFREKARTLQNSHMNVSTILEEIARSYENDGRRADLEAKLRRESY